MPDFFHSCPSPVFQVFLSCEFFRNFAPDLPDALSRRRNGYLRLSVHDAMAEQRWQSVTPKQYHLEWATLHQVLADSGSSHEFRVALACREYDRPRLKKRIGDLHPSVSELQIGNIVREDPRAVRACQCVKN